MGYFFRRSASVGPFRLNFSKSGIGASFGVKGARITATPRGTTYVTVGSHGFYYRETLSNRAGITPSTPAPPAVVPSTSTPRSDEIVTADVSELVDSSSEILIQRLNERARMFNPAWVLYAIALAIFFGAFASFPVAPDQTLPNATLPLSSGRTNNTNDEYTFLVNSYGYPDSVFATEPLGLVSVRTAHYAPAHVNVVLVPNGCVDSYVETMRLLGEQLRYPALAKRQLDNATHCATLPPGGWTIVGYLESSEDGNILAEIVRGRLESLSNRKTTPPVIELESVSLTRKAPTKRSVSKKPLPLKASLEAWALRDQQRENAEVLGRRALYARSALLFAGMVALVVGIVVHRKNKEKRTSRLFYELDEREQQKYSIVEQAIAHLHRSHRIWRVEARSATSDWKRNAGASTLIRRLPVRVDGSRPPHVEMNLPVSRINIGQIDLFFLPDVILYLERGIYGGIAYKDLRVEQSLTRFIEDDSVSADATIVDQTWRYVNKNGGPDKRFRNNSQLPVVQYGALTLTSSRGLNIHLHASNAQESLAFSNCWRALQSHTGTTGERHSTDHRTLETAPAPTELAFRMLGIEMTASQSEVSAAYRHLAQLYHPDKVAGLASEFQVLAETRMKEINAAYEVLKPRPQA